MSYTDQEIVQAYLNLRDEKEKMENRHKLELMPINDKLNTLENIVGVILTSRVTPKDKKPTMKTEVGTAFKKRITNVSITDRPAFLTFAFQEDMSLLAIKASSSGVQDWMEKKTQEQSKLIEGERVNVIIPGIKIDRLDKVIFRKAS